MNILLLDDDYIIAEQLQCLVELENNWQLVTLDEVNYNQIDLVIIDPFNEKYNKILQNILIENSNIKTITISDKLSSSIPKGCDYCNNNYNRIRLIKPVKLKLLFNTINNFNNNIPCPLMHAFSDVKNLIPLILNQFKHLLYDEDSQIISYTSDTDSREYTMQILSLLTLLDKNEIQYTVLNGNAIKLHI